MFQLNSNQASDMYINSGGRVGNVYLSEDVLFEMFILAPLWNKTCIYMLHNKISKKFESNLRIL